MKISSIIRCFFCLRRSCYARYQIGNRTYYSGFGFVSTQCPKKLGKKPSYSYLEHGNDEIKEERLKKVRSRNNHNNKKGE